MVILCAIMAPPPPKVKRAKTLPRSDKYYTIHSHPNNVFGVRVEEETPTCMVGFKNYEDAYVMGRMLETYFIKTKELPAPECVTNFTLPSADQSVNELKHLFLLHNDTENLMAWCTINFLDFLAIDQIIENPDSNKYAWDASIYRPEPEFDLCKERFEYLITL